MSDPYSGMPLLPDDVPVARTSVVVRSYELDAYDHVNHAVFLNYLEHARVEALRHGGFPYEEVAERGWGVYVARVEVDYLSEARLGDELLVHTWVERYRRTSMTLAQVILRAEDPAVVVVDARVTAVWIGPDRKPMRLPGEVRAALGEARGSP